MKKKVIMISSIVSLALIAVVAIIIGVTNAWYIGGSMSQGAALLSTSIDGLSVRVFRGYDYDLDGNIDEHLVEKRGENDLNESYMYIDTNDEVQEIIDNNYITFRLVITNESSYTLDLNPYLQYLKTYKQNSLLYYLDSISVYNHTMRNQDGSSIIDYEKRTLLSNGDYTSYSIMNGVYDTFGNPIYHITDGKDTYSFTYTSKTVDGKTTYTCTTVNNGTENVTTAVVDLTKFYVSDIYDGDGAIESAGDIAVANSKYGKEYNYLNSSTNSYSLENPVAYSYNMYPSNTMRPNKNMSEFMHEEFYGTSLSLDSYSEYYVDVVLRTDSTTSSIKAAVDNFGTKYGTYNETTKKYDFTSDTYKKEYELMEKIYDEKVTNSSLSNLAVDGSVVFTITYFCYDVKVGTEYDSYSKPAYKIYNPEVDI